MRLKFLAGTTCLCAAVIAPSLASAWEHPGLLNSKSSLDRVATFTSTSDPAASSAYTAYRTQYSETNSLFSNQYQPQKRAPGPSGHQIVYAVAGCSEGSPSEEDFEDDAFAAYYNAIRWVRDGNTEAAAKAKSILGKWSTSFQDIRLLDCAGNYRYQVRNEVSWFIPIWINTAEILRNYTRPDGATAGWEATPQANFTGFMDKLWSKIAPNDYHVDLSWEGNSNITASANLAGMAYYVWKGGTNQNNFLMHRDNIRTLVGYIIQNDDGEVREFERTQNNPSGTGDCTHPQYTMIAILQAALIEKNQLNETTIFETRGGAGTTQRVLKGLRYIGDRFAGLPLADDPATPYDESKWTCVDKDLRDGYYQIAKNYYGSSRITSFENAYNTEMAKLQPPPSTRERPTRPGMFTDILRVTHSK